MAEALQVMPVVCPPTTQWHDVIDISGLLPASSTPGMLPQVCGAYLLPLISIASLGCGGPI